MPDLKLIALDAEDLAVISAHLQDAVVRVADMTFLPQEKRFAALANRFDWAQALTNGTAAITKSSLQRRRTGLRFERVLSAKYQGIDVKDKRATLALLAVTFTSSPDPESPNGPKSPGGPELPDGDVTLTFSGGAAIRLAVECLEVEMQDLGAAWKAKHAPQHPDDATS